MKNLSKINDNFRTLTRKIPIRFAKKKTRKMTKTLILVDIVSEASKNPENKNQDK